MADVAEKTLYDTDYYAWTRAQAALLRDMAARRVDSPLDLANLAEEVEDLGTSQRDAVRSQLRRILEHLLKLEYSPARNPRGPWRASIIEARARLEDKLTPSLRRDVEERLPRLYAVARAKVLAEAEGYGEVAPMSEAPESCPYALDDVLRDGWYPANRRGLDGDEADRV